MNITGVGNVTKQDCVGADRCSIRDGHPRMYAGGSNDCTSVANSRIAAKRHLRVDSIKRSHPRLVGRCKLCQIRLKRERSPFRPKWQRCLVTSNDCIQNFLLSAPRIADRRRRPIFGAHSLGPIYLAPTSSPRRQITLYAPSRAGPSPERSSTNSSGTA
jgi:hypothetical protein